MERKPRRVVLLAEQCQEIIDTNPRTLGKYIAGSCRQCRNKFSGYDADGKRKCKRHMPKATAA